MESDNERLASRIREMEAQSHRQRAIFDSAADFAIIATDRDGKVTDWNTGAERILGWSAAEMQGDTVERFFTPEDRASSRPATEMRLSLEDGRANDERWHQRKDGSRFWASGEMMPLRDEAGEHLGFIKMLRDRTAEHRDRETLRSTEARLRESEDHFRNTVELNPQVTWTADPQGNITSYSSRWLDLTGQKPGEPDGAGWIKVLHPDDVEPTVAAFTACLVSGEPVDVDYRIWAAPNQDYRWMRARAYPRRDEEGQIIRWYGVVEDDHDRKTAEIALRESEERYRTLLESVDVGFCIIEMKFDEAGRAVDYLLVEGNPAFERQTGLVGVFGKWVSEVAPGLERHWFDTYGRVALTGEAVHFENGAAIFGRYYDVRAQRVGDPAQHRVAIVFSDITERKRAEDRLRELNDTLETRVAERTAERDRLWQTTDDLMGTADLDGYLKAINPAWTAKLGWSEEELLAKPFSEIIDPRDHAETADVVGRLAKGETVTGFVDHVLTADAGQRTIMWTAVPEPGKSIFYIIGRDITDLRAAARERERTWEVSPVLKMVVSPDGTLLTINPGFTRALGWKPEEVQGRAVADLLSPEDRATSAARRESLNAGGTLPEYQVSFLTKDGAERRISWTTIVEDGVIYAFGRDVTVEREQAEALARSEEALRQSQKMEAVGQLTGGLAHDFNNLLAGISGALELMGMRISQGRITELEKYMVAAQGAAKRAAALTHRLLAFSRRQTLTPKATNVNALVAGMLDMIQRTVGPSVEVESVGASGLWAALVDPSQLENALLNLCINARDAMPEGGKITIETANRWIDRQAAKQHDLPEGQYLSLCISDTGAGMTKEVIEKAFDPFFTTKPIGMGTGLGLSMIYGFARQSGGQVRIYSEVGQGTMVCIYLPRHRGEAESDAVGPEAAVLPFAEAGQTVLVVDDEPTVRLLITDVLADLGYTAIEAAESAGGLRVLQSDARIDLLITDVGLPGMNGRQMVDAARVTRPDLRVLFITGFAENALLNNGQLEPGMSVLTKPFAVDTLAARIRELISRE